MSIGDKEVYPQDYSYEDAGGVKRRYTKRGISYREWLIGMLASNYWMFEPSSSKEPEKRIIDTADAIIKQLDKESE